jgi:hypothetical protein
MDNDIFPSAKKKKKSLLTLLQKYQYRAKSMAQVLENLASKSKSLSEIPNTTKGRRRR